MLRKVLPYNQRTMPKPVLRMNRRSAVLLAAVASAAAAAPLRAELVILTDGNVVKVTAYEAGDEQASLQLAFGGRMTLPIDRVERVVDDEVEPEPEAAPAVAAVAVPDPPIPLRFAESQPIPEGPFGTMIYAAAKKHQVNPQVVRGVVRT